VTISDINRSNDQPRYIVVEGPIGVGKTSLAERLAKSFDAELVLEAVDENPFLERFYRSGRSAALPAQLFFLFQRAKQIEELRQFDMFSPIRIADFHLDKDRLFAETNLDTEELSLYDQIAEKLDIDAPVPDLVVYLQASVDALMQRILRRGVPYERGIDRQYLEKLTEAYARYFHSYDDGPLLIVNASTIDPIHNDDDYEQLYEQIRQPSGGRRFFNPGSVAALA
jgi:deoxyadenosine/deoxycytidine kinase